MFICEVCGKKVATEGGLKKHAAYCGKDRKRVKKGSDPEKALDAKIQEARAQNQAQESKLEKDLEVAAQKLRMATLADSGVRKAEEVAEVQKEVAPKNVEIVVSDLQDLPPSFNPTEIPVGTKVLLNGNVWWKAPSGAFKPSPVVDLIVTVVERRPDDKGVWLICRAEGSEGLWFLGEYEVLQGTYKIVELAVPVAPPADLAAIEADRVQKEKEKERESFRDSLLKYVDARDRKLEVEKSFKVVDKNERPVIWDFTEKYGVESGNGKKDFVVEDSGYKVHLERTPGGYRVEYEEEAIVDWLIANGHNDCIRMVPNFDMWKGLKESGKVPAQIIATVENPVEIKDKFALHIRELKDVSEVEPEFKK